MILRGSFCFQMALDCWLNCGRYERRAKWFLTDKHRPSAFPSSISTSCHFPLWLHPPIPPLNSEKKPTNMMRWRFIIFLYCASHCCLDTPSTVCTMRRTRVGTRGASIPRWDSCTLLDSLEWRLSCLSITSWRVWHICRGRRLCTRYSIMRMTTTRHSTHSSTICLPSSFECQCCTELRALGTIWFSLSTCTKNGPTQWIRIAPMSMDRLGRVKSLTRRKRMNK